MHLAYETNDNRATRDDNEYPVLETVQELNVTSPPPVHADFIIAMLRAAILFEKSSTAAVSRSTIR
jgi:hypothetical protein